MYAKSTFCVRIIISDFPNKPTTKQKKNKKKIKHVSVVVENKTISLLQLCRLIFVCEYKVIRFAAKYYPIYNFKYNITSQY